MQAWPTGFASCCRRCKLTHRVRQQAGSYRCSVTASPVTPPHRHPAITRCRVIGITRRRVVGTACAAAMFIVGDHHRAGLPRCSFVGARLPANGSYCRCRCKLTVRVRQQAGSYRSDAIPPSRDAGSSPSPDAGSSACLCVGDIYLWGPPSRRAAAAFLCRSALARERVLLPPQMQADPPRSPASRLLQVQRTPTRVLLPPHMQADRPRSPASRFLPVQYPPTVTPCKATGFTPCASCPAAADGR
jgi:hypothetical protein